mmetsp:Transcript_63909/g.143727  ORF Transcript_63909/g.143727 Transcript_63909/m.143727 type:complete len:209 (-) Transcript_63909:56-682(-)
MDEEVETDDHYSDGDGDGCCQGPDHGHGKLDPAQGGLLGLPELQHLRLVVVFQRVILHEAHGLEELVQHRQPPTLRNDLAAEGPALQPAEVPDASACSTHSGQGDDHKRAQQDGEEDKVHDQQQRAHDALHKDVGLVNQSGTVRESQIHEVSPAIPLLRLWMEHQALIQHGPCNASVEPVQGLLEPECSDRMHDALQGVQREERKRHP